MGEKMERELDVIEARLNGLGEMYLAAVDAYRAGIIDALCGFVAKRAPEVASVKLGADVDWRWCFDAWLDAAGREISVDFGEQDDYVHDVALDPSRLSELIDFDRASYGYVHVADREFVDVDLAEWNEIKRTRGSVTSR